MVGLGRFYFPFFAFLIFKLFFHCVRTTSIIKLPREGNVPSVKSAETHFALCLSLRLALELCFSNTKRDELIFETLLILEPSLKCDPWAERTKPGLPRATDLKCQRASREATAPTVTAGFKRERVAVL